jgi:hypothetical protein
MLKLKKLVKKFFKNKELAISIVRLSNNFSFDNFTFFISIINKIFSNITCNLKFNKDNLCELFSVLKCIKTKKSFIKNINIIYTLLINALFSSTGKLLRSDKSVKNIKNKILLFFQSIKSDPIFLNLDSEFINNPSEINYNNIKSYFIMKYNELQFILNLPFGYLLRLFLMDDNFVPLFNFPVNPIFGDHENTYQNYIEGKITFSNKSCYEEIIKSLKSGNVEENFIPNKQLIICQKLGFDSGAFLSRLGNPEFNQALGDAVSSGEAGDLIDKFNNGGFQEKVASSAPSEAAVESAESSGSLYVIGGIILLLIIIVIIVVSLCETGTMNCN